MNKILKTEKPYITYSPEISVLFTILSSNHEAFQWLLLEFLSMGIDQVSTVDNLAWFEDYFEECPFIENRFEKIIDIKGSFTDYMMEKIDQKYYVTIPINIRYIKNYYSDKDMLHNLAIYGYNKNESKTFIMDHIKNGRFTFDECTFEEIDRAYQEIENAENNFNYRMSARLIRCKDNVHYDLKREEIREQLLFLIEEVKPERKFFVPQEDVDWIDPKNIRYGLGYYNALADLITDDNQNQFLQRPMFLLVAHSKILLCLSQIIFDKYKIDERYPCKDLLARNTVNLNLFLKDNADIFKKKEHSMQNIRQEILSSREAERKIISRLIKALGI